MSDLQIAAPRALYEAFDDCAMCQYELSLIGPVHGPERPPRPHLERWSMQPEEWHGGGIAVQNSRW